MPIALLDERMLKSVFTHSMLKTCLILKKYITNQLVTTMLTTHQYVNNEKNETALKGNICIITT